MQEEGSKETPQYAQQLRTILKVGASTKKWEEVAKRWSRKSKDRYYRLRELTETEATYSAVLRMIHEKMELPLKQSGAISQQEQREMFPNIEGMIQLSNQIYTDLSQLFSSWNRHTTMIGQTMTRYSRFMLVYSDFFKNYNNTQRKLKLLVQNNQQVQQIQKLIAEPPKRQYFLDLYSKPFQRALKYHLILKDYFKQLHPDHADYKYVAQALDCYHKVNERNNQAINHNEKNQKLIELEKVFPNIIGSDARYLVAESEAMILNQKVRCYILSDRVLISDFEGANEKQNMRIKINYQSFVYKLKDSRYFKNRLLLCGEKSCIYLAFKEVEERDRFATYLSGIIQQIYNNFNYKQQIRQTRRATVSAMRQTGRYSSTTSYRDSTPEDYSSSTYDSKQYHMRNQENPTVEESKEMLKEYAIDRESFKLVEEQMEKLTIGDRMESTNGRSTASQSMESNFQYPTEDRQGSITSVSRLSITNTTAQLPRPPRIIVEGPIKRSYSSSYEKIYFLTRVQLPFPSDRHQLLYIPEDEMKMIQKMVRILYYQYRDIVNAPLLDELVKLMQSGCQIYNLECKSMYFTIILNTIFRHEETSKRLDIFAHKMGITEGFWLALRYPNIQCKCHYCMQGAILTNFQRYNRQLEERNQYKKTLSKTFYCPFRTFHAQDAVLAIPPEQIELSIDRLFRVKCEKGFMEYRLLDNAPLDQSAPKYVIFNIAFGLIPIKHQKYVYKQDRVGQIKHGLVKDLGIDLSEYQICIEVGSQNYVLGDDEILYNILENEQQPETGITGFFKNTFGSSEDTSIKVMVRRIWWFVKRQLDMQNIQKHELKLDFWIESVASRIKNQQIQLNIKDTITFYACYIIYKGQKNVTEPIIECLVPPKKWKKMTSSVKNQQIKTVREKYNDLTKAFLITEGAFLKQYIFTFLMKVLRDRPIWGVFLYQGTTVIDGKQIPVRVGFDLDHFMIKQPEKVTNIYEQKLTEVSHRIVVSCWQLRVKDKSDKEYLVIGTQFQQMMRLLDLYVHFAKTFQDIK